MISIDTIGALIATRHRLGAHCEACGHHAVLDLEALGARLGLGHSTLHDDLAPKLKCSRCGARRIGLILSPPTGTGNPMAGSSNQSRP